MFGLSVEKVLFLAILGAFLAGPERLPKLAVEAARFIQKMRGLSSRALSEFKEQLGPEFENLDAATAWANTDPFVSAGVYQNVTVKPFRKTLPL